MEELELAEALEALQAELARVAMAGAGTDLVFPITEVQLEFHVGVSRTSGDRAGVKFHVVELGGSGSYAPEQIQTVRVTLGAPVDQAGQTLKITRGGYRTPPPGPPFDDDDE